ncbi:MAG: DUF2148 domain-containing protein [Candidatus Omnitrophota bacterium]|jgi:uncharacterized ferredoxin-like protein
MIIHDPEKNAAIQASSLMVGAARTAPKTRGTDNIEILIIDDAKTRKGIIKKMKEMSAKENRPSMGRDANSIIISPVIIVIGVRANPAGLNCGFCGYSKCEELKKTKGICAYNSIDLGIAASSAVSVAGQLHIDNRIMYSIGRACLDLNLFTRDTRQALGIPLSVTGKNPFFDRK